MQNFGNPSVWWNAGLTAEFLRHHFAVRDHREVPVLSLLGDFVGHWTASVREYAEAINVYLLKVPSRFTAVCQPVEVSWNRLLKPRLRDYWTQDLAEQLQQQGPDSAPFKFRVADRAKIVRWIRESWESFS